VDMRNLTGAKGIARAALSLMSDIKGGPENLASLQIFSKKNLGIVIPKEIYGHRQTINNYITRFNCKAKPLVEVYRQLVDG